MKSPHIFEGQQLPLKVEVSRDGCKWTELTLLAITDRLSFPYVCNNATYSHARLIGTKESSVMAQLADAEARVKELVGAIINAYENGYEQGHEHGIDGAYRISIMCDEYMGDLVSDGIILKKEQEGK